MPPLQERRADGSAAFQDQRLDAAHDKAGGCRKPDGASADDGDGQAFIRGHGSSFCISRIFEI